MFVGTLLDVFATCHKFEVLELGIVAFIALCEPMFATRRRPDIFEAIIKVNYGLCKSFELLEAPELLLFRGNMNMCGAPFVNFDFSDLQKRRPVLLYIFPPLAILAERQFRGDELKGICIIVELIGPVVLQRELLNTYVPQAQEY